jgi:hypothetical protein
VKNLVTLGLSLIICSLMLTGCDSPTGPSPNNTPVQTPPVSPPPTPPAPTPEPPPPTPMPPGKFDFTSNCSDVNPNTRKANLSWSASNGTNYYKVERRTGTSGSWDVAAGNVTGTSFSQDVRNDLTFYYRVYAVNSVGQTLSTPPELEVCSARPRGDPSISFTNVPPKGSFSNLRGVVRFAVPADHRVIVYIKVSSWWVKPYFNSPLTRIADDGSWETDITTGGVDQTATEIAAFLVTKEHVPNTGVSNNLPISVNGKDVLAVTTVTR